MSSDLTKSLVLSSENEAPIFLKIKFLRYQGPSKIHILDRKCPQALAIKPACSVRDSPRNVVVEEKSKEPEADEEKSVTPDKIGKDEAAPTRGKGKGGSKNSATASSSEAPKMERKRSADRKSRQARRNSMLATPPPGATTPVSDADNQR